MRHHILKNLSPPFAAEATHHCSKLALGQVLILFFPCDHFETSFKPTLEFLKHAAFLDMPLVMHICGAPVTASLPMNADHLQLV